MEPFPRCIQAVLKAVRHSVAAARLFSLALRLRFRPLIHLQARSSKHWRCQQLIRRTETDSGLQSRVQIKLVGGLSWLYGIIVFCETLRFLTSLRKWIDCKIYILIMAQPFFTFLRYSSLSFLPGQSAHTIIIIMLIILIIAIQQSSQNEESKEIELVRHARTLPPRS